MNKKMLSIPIILMMVFSLAAAPYGQFDNGGLQPGGFEVFDQKIPINLVFIGYDQSEIDQGALLSTLPATYDPLVRYPEFYGISGRPMGLHFDFAYKMIFANDNFENRFFKQLKRMGTSGDPTLFQLDYNDQVNNVLDVSGPVLYLDAPTVETLLMNSTTQLGINRQKSYTIFFINWYSRPDFMFHVYTKTDEPDPDTGYNFGDVRASRKGIAWGGGYSRTWFYDLSAGPEAWTDNWNVDDPDLDGNGYEDYRMPPIWEYTSGGYRDPSALSTDLGLVTRFVGIDLLFTPSPLYDPMVTAPKLNGGKITHIEMFQDDPGSNGLDWIDMDFIYNKLYAFEPYYTWSSGLEDNNPIDPGAARALRIFGELLVEDDCWNAFGTPFAQPFCYFDANYDAYVPPYAPEDYVAPVFAFNTTAANLGSQWGLLGFADDNWVDGTQSYVFAFDAAEYRDLGYGFSTTAAHEVGHHIGLSHPHDGYDAEYGLDFGPGDDFYFAWSGDESGTIMSYLDLTYNFGQFNQDSMYRYEMAGFMNWSNDLADDILTHPEYGKVRMLYKMAEINARKAKQAFASWDYLSAVNSAYTAYNLLLKAAEQLGIPTESFIAAYRVVPGGSAPHEGDPIRFPDN